MISSLINKITNAKTKRPAAKIRELTHLYFSETATAFNSRDMAQIVLAIEKIATDTLVDCQPEEMKITDEMIAEWRSEQGKGMTSAVGEYIPAEFWLLLDEYERVRGDA